MYINAKGLVLREVKYGDNSRILTVLTDSEGKLTVSAHGVYRKNSRLAAAVNLFVLSHMTLTQRRGRWSLTEAECIEQFTGLRDDLKLLSLASYFSELTESAADEDCPGTELLSLCLNALYALSEKLKSPELIKTAFELRLMAISGYTPVLMHDDGGADYVSSAAYNSNKQGFDGSLSLGNKALRAAEYILTCDLKRLFLLNLDGGSLTELTSKTEQYLLTHLERGFKTLDFYKKLDLS